MGRTNPIPIGSRFLRLTVAGPSVHGKYPCVCDCGAMVNVRGYYLSCGRVMSCGCFRRESCGDRFRRHGLRNSTEYTIWRRMLQRCLDPHDPGHKNYGDRGILVCERWLGDRGFLNFLSDMGCRPSRLYTIDRVDNNGTYSPGNCRWATRAEQSRNTRRNYMITYNGVTLCKTDWAARVGLTYSALHHRLKSGWSPDNALTPPRRKRRTAATKGPHKGGEP